MLAPINVKMDVLDEIFSANSEDLELEDLRQQARENEMPYTLEPNGLLLHKGRLAVPMKNNLRARLLRMIRESTLIAHTGRNKIRKLVGAQY